MSALCSWPCACTKELFIWTMPDVHWWGLSLIPAPGTLVISKGFLQNGQHGFFWAAFFVFTCLHRFIVIAVLLEQGLRPCSIISMSLQLDPISAAKFFCVNPALRRISFISAPSIYLLFFVRVQTTVFFRRRSVTMIKILFPLRKNSVCFVISLIF